MKEQEPTRQLNCARDRADGMKPHRTRIADAEPSPRVRVRTIYAQHPPARAEARWLKEKSLCFPEIAAVLFYRGKAALAVRQRFLWARRRLLAP